MTDREYIEQRYLQSFGKPMRWGNPQTFNEKLNWLKLYDTPRYWLADKYSVRQYVKERVGEKVLIPLLGVWERAEEIDFDQLPNQFVVKPTHGSAWYVIVKDKNKHNWEESKAKLDHWMRTNYYMIGREPVYRDIHPRIVAEPYLGELIDYKLFCFHGEPRVVCVVSDRLTSRKVTWFDCDWKRLNIKMVLPASPTPIPRPDLDTMVDVARKLAADIPFVRIDLYQTDRVLFGEMTFYPNNAFSPIHPEVWDYRLGSYLTLPSK